MQAAVYDLTEVYGYGTIVEMKGRRKVNSLQIRYEPIRKAAALKAVCGSGRKYRAESVHAGGKRCLKISFICRRPGFFKIYLDSGRDLF
jgi:hypothetical protein